MDDSPATMVRRRLSFSTAIDIMQSLETEQEKEAAKEVAQRFQSKLETIDTANLGITQLAEAGMRAWDSRKGVPLSEMLDTIKAQFSKLKFRYLELESKKGFLEDLAGEEALSRDLDTKISKLESLIGEARQGMKILKKSNEELSNDIDSWASELMSSYDRLLEERNDFNKLVELYVKKYDELDMDSPRKRRKTLENEEKVRTAKVSLEKVKKLVDPMDTEIVEMKTRIETAKSNLKKEIDRRQEEDKQARDAVGDDVWEMNDWYKAALKVVEKIGGISVDRFTPKAAILKINCLNSEGDSKGEYSLTIGIDSTTGLVQSTTLVPDDVHIDDVVDHCKKYGDIPFLVREVRTRCSHYYNIGRDIDRLKAEGHTVGWRKPTATSLKSFLVVKMKDNEEGNSISFECSADIDFPTSHREIEINSISDRDSAGNIVRRPDSLVEKVMNGVGSSSLYALFDLIRSA